MRTGGLGKPGPFCFSAQLERDCERFRQRALRGAEQRRLDPRPPAHVLAADVEAGAQHADRGLAARRLAGARIEPVALGELARRVARRKAAIRADLLALAAARRVDAAGGGAVTLDGNGYLG